MKIPEKVKIGGYIITVLRKDMEINLGEYHHFTQEIWLDEGLTEQCFEEVFLHEILEAIKDIYSLDYPHEILNLIGVVLHAIIKDNPDIFVEESNENHS
jgi:hypothetical protein